MVLLILHEPESPRIQKRDDRWIALACNAYGLPELGLEHNVALGGNDVLLSILIVVSRRTLHSPEFWLVETLNQFYIADTLPALQHGFCALRNELVQETNSQQGFNVQRSPILRLIRHLYVALHPGADST